MIPTQLPQSIYPTRRSTNRIGACRGTSCGTPSWNVSWDAVPYDLRDHLRNDRRDGLWDGLSSRSSPDREHRRTDWKVAPTGFFNEHRSHVRKGCATFPPFTKGGSRGGLRWPMNLARPSNGRESGAIVSMKRLFAGWAIAGRTLPAWGNSHGPRIHIPHGQHHGSPDRPVNPSRCPGD